MHYFDWIQAKKEGRLTAAELRAYQHERAENDQLRAEEGAWDVVDILLGAAATGMLVDQIEEKPVGQGRGLSGFWVRLGIGAAILLVAVALGLWLGQSTFTPEEPVREWGPRFTDPEQWVPERDVPMASLPVPAYRERLPKEEPVVPMAVEVQEPEIRVPDLVEPEDAKELIVTNIKIEKGGRMSIQGKEVITLKPGFHAKAGASFRATVEDK